MEAPREVISENEGSACMDIGVVPAMKPRYVGREGCRSIVRGETWLVDEDLEDWIIWMARSMPPGACSELV